MIVIRLTSYKLARVVAEAAKEYGERYEPERHPVEAVVRYGQNEHGYIEATVQLLEPGEQDDEEIRPEVNLADRVEIKL